MENKSYYNGTGCLDAMVEAFGLHSVRDFCKCNAMKYIWRCGKKTIHPREDIEKAIWYLNKTIELDERIQKEIDEVESDTSEPIEMDNVTLMQGSDWDVDKDRPYTD